MTMKDKTNLKAKDISQGYHFDHIKDDLKKRFKWAKIPLIDKKMTKTQYQEKMKQWSQQYDTTTFDGDWN
jgi:hypothetical protein